MTLKIFMEILMELDTKMEWLFHHLHTLILLNLMILQLLPPKMRHKLLKLRDFKCQIIREGLLRLNLHWHLKVRLKLEHHNLGMLIYTLDITTIDMLLNTMHINILHKPIKIYIVIVILCLTLWPKIMLENINHNIKTKYR